MSVGGRYIYLQDKASTFIGFGVQPASSLYGVDVAGFYLGNKVGFGKIDGRWRAGFNTSNLRGKSSVDNRVLEIYAPSTLKLGAGFDFIFNRDSTLGVTGEYKTLLNSYTENANGEPPVSYTHLTLPTTPYV